MLFVADSAFRIIHTAAERSKCVEIGYEVVINFKEHALLIFKQGPIRYD